jgi:hypothetical protein
LSFLELVRAENGIFALSRLKIRTWTTMPLKGHIIATFKGLLSDCSLCRNGKKSISRNLVPGDKKSTECRYISISNITQCLSQASTGRAIHNEL